MLDYALIITAVYVQPDNSIQRNANPQELEHFVQECTVVIIKHQL